MNLSGIPIDDLTGRLGLVLMYGAVCSLIGQGIDNEETRLIQESLEIRLSYNG